MKFLKLETKVTSGRGRRVTFCPESLEGRNLLSTVVAPLAPHVQVATHTENLKGSGTGVISLADLQTTGRVTYTATGHISHLGHVTITGSHSPAPAVVNGGPGDAITNGQLTITAANGDQLVLSYTGGGNLISTPAELAKNPPIYRFNDTFNFTIDGAKSTGRFAGATGSGVVHAIDQSPSAAQYAHGQLPFTFDLSGVVSNVGPDHNHPAHH